MTLSEAKELRYFLMDALYRYGFSEIVDEVNDIIISEIEVEHNKNPNEKDLLTLFLTRAISVINQYSNKNFKGILDRLNNSLSEGKVEGIRVELPGTESEYFDLSELPDYREISLVLQGVLEEINLDNEEDSDYDNTRNQ